MVFLSTRYWLSGSTSCAGAVASCSLHDGKGKFLLYQTDLCLNFWYGEECCILLFLRSPTLFLVTELLFFQQENAIITMELRNYFSLYCLHQETQLIHIYLPLTSHILGAFVNSQIQGHKEVSSRLCPFSQNTNENLNGFVFTHWPSCSNQLCSWALLT